MMMQLQSPIFNMIMAFGFLCLGSGPVFGQTLGLLACRPSAVGMPHVGAYSLFVDDGRHLCVAPDVDADDTHVPCLRIGQVHVGQVRTVVEELLGEPWQSAGTDGSAFAYLVYQDSVEKRGAYYVVTYEEYGDEQIAQVVQFTGDRPEGFYQFSCLDLEADTTEVRRQLGTPADREPIQISQDLRGTVWHYGSTPFSVEVIDDRLYSIRVWRPLDVAPRPRRMSLIKQKR